MPPPSRELPAKRERLRLIFELTRRNDPRIVPLLVVAFLGPVAVLVVVGVLIGNDVLMPIAGVLLGALAALGVFNLRSRKAVNAELEGKPGAAASIVEGMQGNWRVTPAVQVNRNQDLVHRVVGRSGVVLIGEGSPRGTRDLMANEKRRLARVIGSTPVHEVFVGNGDGEVPIRKLSSHVQRLPRNLRKAQIEQLDRRLRALTGSGAGALPIPKGPIPTRIPRGRIR